jgi:hypothetical protein
MKSKVGVCKTSDLVAEVLYSGLEQNDQIVGAPLDVFPNSKSYFKQKTKNTQSDMGKRLKQFPRRLDALKGSDYEEFSCHQNGSWKCTKRFKKRISWGLCHST